MSSKVFARIKWKQVWLTAVGSAVLYGIFAWMLKPDVIDFVNVALIPELAEEVGADLTARLQLAHIGHEALRSAQGIGMVHRTGRDRDAQVLQSLKFSGQEVFDLLTVEQRKAFYYLFRSRDVVPIEYHTEESDVRGVPRFTLSFGWKQTGGSLNGSLADTAAELENAWEWIPQRKVAEALASHHSAAVSNAADAWLSEHSPKKAKRSERSFEDRTSAMRASHEERTQDMRRDFDRRVAENRAAHERRSAESHDKAEQASADRKVNFERRRTKMRADHEKRAAAMRTDHERRVQEMRKE